MARFWVPGMPKTWSIFSRSNTSTTARAAETFGLSELFFTMTSLIEALMDQMPLRCPPAGEAATRNARCYATLEDIRQVDEHATESLTFEPARKIHSCITNFHASEVGPHAT